MRIAYVTVRYGADIPGGAEQACRQLATHLALEPGVDVSVYTTCATDAVTWGDRLTPGTTVEDGVTVHRYRSESGRDPSFERFSTPVLADPVRQSASTEQEWMRRQGPVCPAATDAAIDSPADLVVCTPYLYWPTYAVATDAPERFVMHPAAHDEAPIRLPLFTAVFGAARGLAFYTDAERRLVERLWPSRAAVPQIVCGLGIDLVDVSSDLAFRAAADLGERPYLLCLGRVDDGKGVGVLARFFAAYKRRRPGPLALVFAGPVVHEPPPHPDVIVTGQIDDARKWSALAGCHALVSASANESFSIVVLEAWTQGRPVLVNARCGPTSEHARRSGGGIAFGSYAAFETAVDRLLRQPALADAMGAAGRSYVERSFAWPIVIARYRRWLERVADATVH